MKKDGWIHVAKSTDYKRVNGMFFDGEDLTHADICVRITADDNGVTLSLSDDVKCQFIIDLADIEDKLREVLKNDN